MQRRYVYGVESDVPLVMYDGAATTAKTWLYRDQLGSVIATASGTGTRKEAYTYGPFGEPNVTTGVRFRYTGQWLIGDVDLYYYKARFYSPKLGRFLQTDPIGYKDDLNLYAYVKNDPINYVDPTGLAVVGFGFQGGAAAGAGYMGSAQIAISWPGGLSDFSWSKAKVGYILSGGGVAAAGVPSAGIGLVATVSPGTNSIEGLAGTSNSSGVTVGNFSIDVGNICNNCSKAYSGSFVFGEKALDIHTSVTRTIAGNFVSTKKGGK